MNKDEKQSEKTGLELLRAPFPTGMISKLPKPTSAQTEEVKRDYKKGARCNVCGQWHHPAVVHLDYVGHAALTDRLLDVDPHWSWEPLALGPDGLPALDKDGGMWIKLTILDMTRLGYGDAQGKTGPNATKERIGDALRNAAMRFGAALDLWSKADLHGDEDEVAPSHEQPGKHIITDDELKSGAAKIMAEIKAAQDEGTIDATLKNHHAVIEEIKKRAPKWWNNPEKGTGILSAMNAKINEINAFETRRNNDSPFDGEMQDNGK